MGSVCGTLVCDLFFFPLQYLCKLKQFRRRGFYGLIQIRGVLERSQVIASFQGIKSGFRPKSWQCIQTTFQEQCSQEHLVPAAVSVKTRSLCSWGQGLGTVLFCIEHMNDA